MTAYNGICGGKSNIGPNYFGVPVNHLPSTAPYCVTGVTSQHVYHHLHHYLDNLQLTDPITNLINTADGRE
jgi:hypothetical protein